MESLWSFAFTVFMAFFAIMNPIANIPIFVKLTEGLDQKEKKQIAKTSNIVAFIIIVAFILIGKYIFEIFGLTIPAFKVFGGVLIFFIGFDMLQTKKTNVNIQGPATYDENIAIFPLSIPILAGPGTIVTGMNFVVSTNIIHMLLTILIFGLIILITYFAFVYSRYIVEFVGEKKFVIIGKIMGIIIGVLGANMLIQGIKLAFNLGE
ncbi:MAG: MarC family protein [Paludibacter sp.]